jgi:hypothetical protein
VRSWLGTNAVTSDPLAGLATTRPPLSATPSGVTWRQAAVAVGRTNTCQKFSCCAADPPISTTVQLAPPVLANEVVSGGGAGAAGSDVEGAGVLPQPATSKHATAIIVPAAVRGPVMTPASGTARPRW